MKKSISLNNLDIRPYVDKIVLAINKWRAKTPHDKPVFVLIGEWHNSAEHQLAQQMLLQRLRQSEFKPVIGFETDHDFLAKCLRKKVYIPRLRSLYDRDGCFSLQAYLACAFGKVQPPLSSINLRKFCVNSVISCRFNDLSHTDIDPFPLDMEDPLTQQLTNQNVEKYDECRPVNPTSTLGVKLRNIGMVYNALNHLSQTSAPVYIHIVGTNHIRGMNRKYSVSYKYEDSMVALLKRENISVFTIMLPDLFPLKSKFAVFSENADQLSVLQKIAEDSGREIHIFDPAQTYDDAVQQYWNNYNSCIHCETVLS